MNGHAGLALATAAFVGSHLALSHPLRLKLVRNLGEGPFVLLYSVVAAATLLAMILAWRGIGQSLPLWIAPGWAWWLGSALILLACILLAGSFMKNPAFPQPGARAKAVRPATGVFAITRHPMNWAFALWALVHISLWGSPRNLIVAGGLLLLAILGSIGQDRKKANVMGETWRRWQAATSFVPFGALVDGRIAWRKAAPGWIAAGGGLALWLAVTWLHAPSVSPVAALLGGAR